jgi:NAD(P)-dependent dehydrogenase (short-subunit alcohol dehydrogenase family)
MGTQVVNLDLKPPAKGGQHRFEACDLRDSASVDEVTRRLLAELGPCSVLAACHGVSTSAPVHEMSDETWREVLGVNLDGVFFVTRRALGSMLEQGEGRIVAISAGSGVRPYPATAAYAASKAGVIAFMKAVALEGAPKGITANVVAPGLVDTPMTRRNWSSDEDMRATATASRAGNPMGHILEPEEIAAAVTFLVSPNTAHITGQTLHVNSGSLMP